MLWELFLVKPSGRYPEIALKIGDTYEQVERASSYKMGRDASFLTGSWFTDVREPASLHFNDPDYFFITPPAKFLSISAGGGGVTSIRMSPQVETLPLKETIDVVVDLEKQLERSGWTMCKPTDFSGPAYKDDPEITKKLLSGKSPGVYWRAGNKYGLNYDTGRFSGDPAKGDDRYLITISLGRNIAPHCFTPEEEEADRKRIEALPKNPPRPPTPVTDWLESIKTQGQ